MDPKIYYCYPEVAVEPQTLERLLHALTHRQPFKPFTVVFVNGGHIEVDHPEALVSRNGVAVYLDSAGVPNWFDHLSITRIVGAVEQAPSQ